ncbi:MAG: hypothetical protein ACTHLW_17585 [Verrucomicrobiota bacterium]
MDMIRWFVHEPFLGGVVLLCVSLVGALILSDWLEKRRTRQFLQVRDDLKEVYQRQQASAGGLGQLSEMANLRAARGQRPVFKLFRWEFALLSTLLVALWNPNKFSQPILVQARALQASEKAAKANTAAETHSPMPSITPMIDAPRITLRRGSVHLTPDTISFQLESLHAAWPFGSSESSWNAVPETLNHSVTTLFESASDQDCDFDGIEDRSTALALRNSFPIGRRTQFTALLEDSARGRFSR